MESLKVFLPQTQVNYGLGKHSCIFALKSMFNAKSPFSNSLRGLLMAERDKRDFKRKNGVKRDKQGNRRTNSGNRLIIFKN